jgi:hypothetical protein
VPARKIIAKIVRAAGVVLGLGALALFAHVMWPVIAMDPNSRNAMRDVMVIIFGGFGVLALVAWPFALIADYIDSPLRRDAQTIDAQATPETLTSPPRSRHARSTASKPAKR